MVVANEIFVSYSHADIAWLKRLQVHLKPLQRDGLISLWDDTRIKPGSRWRTEIREALDRAKVAVLLVSADFLASEFISTQELPPLLAAAERRGTLILPIIISPCRFEQTPSLACFQAVNPPDEPLVRMRRAKSEEVFVKISTLIERAFAPQSTGATLSSVSPAVGIQPKAVQAVRRKITKEYLARAICDALRPAWLDTGESIERVAVTRDTIDIQVRHEWGALFHYRFPRPTWLKDLATAQRFAREINRITIQDLKSHILPDQ